MSNATRVREIREHISMLELEYPGFDRIIRDVLFQWVDERETDVSNPLAEDVAFRIRNANKKGAYIIEILALLPPQQWRAFMKYIEAWIQKIVGQDSLSIQEKRWEQYIETHLDITHTTEERDTKPPRRWRNPFRDDQGDQLKW